MCGRKSEDVWRFWCIAEIEENVSTSNGQHVMKIFRKCIAILASFSCSVDLTAVSACATLASDFMFCVGYL